MTQNYQKSPAKFYDRLDKEGLDFEKLLITLATGTIVLSVTFLGYLFPLPPSKVLLIFSWISLILSIFFGLIDRILYISEMAEYLKKEEDFKKQEITLEKSIKLINWMEKVSWLQIITFFVGIVLLLTFAIFNL